MDVARPVRRWRATGKPQRTELLVRWSLYSVAVAQPLVTLSLLGGLVGRNEISPLAVRVAVFGSVLAAAANVALFRVTLPAYLGRRARPTGWICAAGALALAVGTATLVVGPHPGPDGPAAFSPGVLTVTVSFWLASASLGLAPARAAATGLVGLALTAVPLLVAGLSPFAVLGLLIGSALGALLGGVTYRSSAWMARVVWELDAARETQARLAVAEERLRFSRDLHDVLGRNLTTIALKSELAVQLARRGRPEAADQMTEVQRIAQESHREVREVVRGYRSADLQAEVTGARAVLRAADVACELAFTTDPAALPVTVQSVLGWVVREAATNVLRHSEAARCAIRLRTADGAVVLEVENDGVRAVPAQRGADPTGADPGGSGLAGLRERLCAYGGALDVPAADPGTFKVTATLPLALPPALPAPEVPTR
ncbi:histidine kinase [Kitasatospora paracochleata]|uniref:Two-component system sensor histidine kinase DesK n=1 Tax=Kitasatospora paracochleata TaxID=58354 RepID=A0ABT1J7L7_9ACTN|nr:histidine kinase [Kitasatospora paracochleata]MCP2313108.1 two-component system sensor histidine kinase DesK [Kitasatospora paracochleata]